MHLIFNLGLRILSVGYGIDLTSSFHSLPNKYFFPSDTPYNRRNTAIYLQ